MNRTHQLWRLAAALSAPLIASAARAADFNGDHFDDLAIVSRGPGDPNVFFSGRVTVLFGSAGSGLTSVGLIVIDPALFGVADDHAQLGDAIAAGDFDGDGFDDLAMGMPGASFAGQPEAGLVAVVPGSAMKFDFGRAVVWSQDSPGVKDKIEPPFDLEGHHLTERFGSALAAGDFDGDGFDDLAIGVAESTKTVPNAGAIHVLFGSPTGLVGKKAHRLRFITQETPGVKGASEEFDYFGGVLHAADLDGDGRADLALQASGEITLPSYASGALEFLFGSKHGIVTNKHHAYGAKKLGEPEDTFLSLSIASAFASGDIDGDGVNEIIVGMPGHSDNAGRVLIGRLPHRKLDIAGLQSISAADIDAMVAGVEGDTLGRALACADFDHDGFDDVAISASGSDLPGITNAGRVGILRGSPSGLVLPGKFLVEGSGGVSGTAEQFDNAGEALTAGDFNGDGFGDLVIGIPRQDVDVVVPMPATLPDAGAFTVVYGAAGGLGTGTSAQFSDPSGALSFGEFGLGFCR